MKLNLTALIIAAACLVWATWAVGEFSKPLNPPAEIKVNYTIADSTNKAIKQMQLAIDSLRLSQASHKIQRTEVPKKVAAFTPNDITRINDSISAANNLR